MRTPRAWRLGPVFLLVCSVGCGPTMTEPGTDAAADGADHSFVSDAVETDAAARDRGAIDPPVTDAGRGDVQPTDAQGADARVFSHPCAIDRLINLNTAGTTVGPRRTRYVGSNADTPASTRFTTYFTCSHPGHEVAFAYTLRTSSRLRISTNNPGTTDNFDTIVFAMNDPEPSFPTAPTECQAYSRSGCNDDVYPRDVTRSRASQFITSRGLGGTAVIVVAGYTPANAGYTDTGTFELTVDEVDVPLGAACDPGISMCASGSVCVSNGTTSTCVSPGGIGAPCRSFATPLCDMGLACSIANLCRSAVAAGAPCDPLGGTNACAAGSTCASVDARSTCVTHGTNGGACRPESPGCDTGLACSRARVCRPLIADGSACHLTGDTNTCGTNSDCLVRGAENTCLARGSNGGRCRATGSLCDTGLTCSGLLANTDSRCRTIAALGDPCDLGRAMNACAAPASCVTHGSTPLCALAGYTQAPLIAPMFLDACARGGLHVPIGGASRDDAHSTAALSLPFSFEFFRVAETQIWASINGYAVFGAVPPSDTFVGPIPLVDEGALIAPFLDDLVLRAAPDSDLCARTFGAAPSRRFVLEWLDVRRRSDDTTHLTFEVILDETTGSMDFIYRTVTGVDSARASVGLQNSTGLVTAVHSDAVTTTTGLRWTAVR